MSTDLEKANPGVAKQELSPSERFTAAVMRETSSTLGEAPEVTSFQKKLSNNYFIKIDGILKDSERKRLATKEEFRTQPDIEYAWKNVNIDKLALDVIAYSSVGLDPLQKNHIFPIPFKNTAKAQFDITFIIGYRGIELKAKKYGLDVPDVTVEIVYEKDKFKAIKKDKLNPTETYTFEIQDAFDRGEIVGGFYFHEYTDKPNKNKIRPFTLKDIEKRRPEKASPEFWGGTKKVKKWVPNPNDPGKKMQVEAEEKTEGWFEEMVYKTIYRAAYEDITIDSEKIDQHLVSMLQSESQALPAAPEDVQSIIDTEGNQELTDFVDVSNQATQLEEPAKLPDEADQPEKQPVQKASEQKVPSATINTEPGNPVQIERNF